MMARKTAGSDGGELGGPLHWLLRVSTRVRHKAEPAWRVPVINQEIFSVEDPTWK
jgi:hypothetical protein